MKKIKELEERIDYLECEIERLNHKLDIQNEKRGANFYNFIDDLVFRNKLITTNLIGSVRDPKLKVDLLNRAITLYPHEECLTYSDFCNKIINDFDFASTSLVKSCLEDFERQQMTLDLYSPKKATPAKKVAVANITKNKKEK